MPSADDLALATVTWRGDLDHFRWLRRSLRHFGLGALPHVVVVHTEDAARFADEIRDGVQLLTTAEVLPADVERARVRALHFRARFGRRAARLLLSLSKRLGWPDFIRCEGWQVQQLSKLALASHLRVRRYVVIDSDVVICGAPDLALFGQGAVTSVFEQWLAPEAATVQQRRWYATAVALFGADAVPQVNGYVGTPFVFERETVLALQAALARISGRHWTRGLLDQRPGRWSEFASYSQFARHHADPARLRFRDIPHHRRIGEPEERAQTAALIDRAFDDPQAWFLTIESDQRLAGRHGVSGYADALARHLG